MNKLFFAAFVGWVGLAGSAKADPPVSAILRNPRSDFSRTYMAALGSGMSWYLSADNHHHKKGLYCPPGKVALTPDQYISILERFVDENPKFRSDPVGGTLMFALQDAFPCP
jgi:hypothetical protein